MVCYRATHWADETIDMARRSLVGSVSPVYYEGMADLDAMLAFVNELKAVSAVPVLSLSGQACEMHSWGASPLPGENGSMIFGAARDADLCYRCARAASIESKAVGFDCVWSPCADVNTNPRNPIIGTRAFSDRVARIAQALQGADCCGEGCCSAQHGVGQRCSDGECGGGACRAEGACRH